MIRRLGFREKKDHYQQCLQIFDFEFLFLNVIYFSCYEC